VVFDKIAWNHQQFWVRYPSLNDEVKVGNVYMHLLFQAGDGFIKNWEEPQRLFEVLFQKFLCELVRKVAVSSVRCLLLSLLHRLSSHHVSSVPIGGIHVYTMLGEALCTSWAQHWTMARYHDIDSFDGID
jgi:hypothetical protein